ncbi:MAG: hypothetical protein ACI8RD_001834 [Bacillariaceae sp.]|jgi:hypothetical protein
MLGDEVRDLIKKGVKPKRAVINNDGGARGKRGVLSNDGDGKSKLSGLGKDDSSSKL